MIVCYCSDARRGRKKRDKVPEASLFRNWLVFVSTTSLPPPLGNNGHDNALGLCNHPVPSGRLLWLLWHIVVVSCVICVFFLSYVSFPPLRVISVVAVAPGAAPQLESWECHDCLANWARNWNFRWHEDGAGVRGRCFTVCLRNVLV